MSRSDGRSASALRPLEIVLETLDRVDGSASFAFGQIKALASVSGPIQVRLAAELPSKATFEVSVRPLSGVPGTDSKSFAAVLRSSLVPSLILTQNPRTLIQLVVQSLSPTPTPFTYPSLTAALINASTLALLRASSFPMVGVVCSAAVGRVKQSNNEPGTLLLDPTDQEMSGCDAFGCIAVMFKSSPDSMDELGGEMVWSSLQGAPLQSDYDALIRLGKIGARAVYDAIRDRLRASIENTGMETETHPKKMPKHKGGRVVLNVTADDTMDTS
ncbi:exosome component Rrp46 [Hysterangium stoloniferum]|nr:exosome component Rrp46 [Hysterangium stoloniferum]